MNLELTPEQAEALVVLLKQSLPEMSHEIADTDNAAYRSELNVQRAELQEVEASLTRLLAAQVFPPKSGAEDLERELAHPGD